MILRFAAALQDRYLKIRYREYRPVPRRGDDPAWYRKRRPVILAAVLAWMAARKIRGVP